jgi:hypothetical protein
LIRVGRLPAVPVALVSILGGVLLGIRRRMAALALTVPLVWWVSGLSCWAGFSR